MKMRRRGFTLVEILAAMTVLGLAVLTSLALFPLSSVMRERSGGYSRAGTLLQRKLEQIRQLPPTAVTPAGLQAAGIVDTATGAALPFTTTDQVASQLTRGTGTVTLRGVGTDLVRVDVQVTWVGYNGRQSQVQEMTYVAMTSAWREP